jgi:Family of unknown function (DUF6191)
MTQWGLDTLFNPSKRHMDEEKRRLQATREEVGDNSGGERIDVESGTVVIKRKAGAPDEAATPSAKSRKPVEDDDADTPAARARRRRAAARATQSKS